MYFSTSSRVAGPEGAPDVGGDEQLERRQRGRRHQQPARPAVRHAADAVDQYEAFHPPGVGEGEGLGGHAAHGVADRGEAADAEVVEEGDDVPGEGVEGGRARAGALAVSAQVEADHAAVRGEVGRLVVPAVPVGGPTVDEDQRGARGVAGAFVVVGQFGAVDRDRAMGASPSEYLRYRWVGYRWAGPGDSVRRPDDVAGTTKSGSATGPRSGRAPAVARNYARRGASVYRADARCAGPRHSPVHR